MTSPVFERIGAVGIKLGLLIDHHHHQVMYQLQVLYQIRSWKTRLSPVRPTKLVNQPRYIGPMSSCPCREEQEIHQPRRQQSKPPAGLQRKLGVLESLRTQSKPPVGLLQKLEVTKRFQIQKEQPINLPKRTGPDFDKHWF